MQISAALKLAMKEKDAERLSTLRLINAAIKDRDIANRSASDEEKQGCGNAEVLEILGKMAKQRKESARAYEEGGRLDLAEREEREIEVIQEFMPRQLDDKEVERAIEKAITDTGAGSIRDMGKVMGELKSRYQGRMDFGKVGPRVKDQLCAGQTPCQ
ncbi:GatB/YqeY domain-containing protein [Cribrihabitans sp. XS_ASV171]